MNLPHPIPYQGSKRNIAKIILSFFPNHVDTLIEPFAGSASISIAAACFGKANQFHLNDINKPLMALWHEIIYNPDKISYEYEKLWNEQKGKEREFYDFIRQQFNKFKKPEHLLYLLARCVKASVRYNTNGEFNQSPDNRRKGRHPIKMRDDIFSVSELLNWKTVITSKDYCEILSSVSSNCLIYMDPPYQGICNGRDPRYYKGIDLSEFICQLENLIKKQIPFLLSYDGRKGEKIYGIQFPVEMGLHRIEINAGRSSQSTLLGRSDITYESIYLSEELLIRLNLSTDEIMNKVIFNEATQLMLPINND